MQNIRYHRLYQEQICMEAKAPLEWDRLSHKTILITGATGMIGTFLIDVLMKRNSIYHENIHIIAIGRDEMKARRRLGEHFNKIEFTFVEHDVNQSFHKLKLPQQIDYIIHGASNTHPIQYSTDPIGTIEANVWGTKNLLELASKYKNCRLVFLSSVEIYGENRGDIEYITEEYCGYINCNTLRAGYPESKRLGEALCQAYISARGIDVVIPRLCRVYGPTMLTSDSKALAQFIKKAVAEENIILKSSGMQEYSFIYVADAASAILTIMFKGRNKEAYNVADNRSNSSLKDIAKNLADISKKEVRYEIPDDVEKNGYSTATKALLDSKKLKALGWKSTYDIKKGLQQTYDILKESFITRCNGY